MFGFLSRKKPVEQVSATEYDIPSFDMKAHRREVDEIIAEVERELRANEDTETRRARLESERRIALRNEFLAGTNAVPTPIDVYALWVKLWLRQGKKVQESKGASSSWAFASEFGAMSSEEQGEARKFPKKFHSNWMPTNGSVSIPEGYGSYQMNVMVMTNATGQGMASPHRNRRGWEFGHSSVFFIERVGDGYRAYTYSTEFGGPRVDSTVMEIVRRDSIETILARLGSASRALELTA